MTLLSCTLGTFLFGWSVVMLIRKNKQKRAWRELDKMIRQHNREEGWT